MKRINLLLAVAAMMLISGVVAVAQGQQCTEDYLNETYTKWYEPYKARDTSQEQKDLAYQIAKEYVNKCPNEFPDNAYAKALKSYVQVYEKVQATGKVAADFDAAVKNNNYAEQVRLGKQIVAGTPDNALVYIFMANAGLNDANLSADALQAAKKAIELIEGGKPFAPAYASKDQALAAMNWVIAKMTVKSSATDAITYFIKAAKYGGPLQKDVHLYNELAAAYAEQVDKLTKQYEPFIGKPETPESKLVLANLNAMTDAYIDALARATAVADAANKPAFLERLTSVYKIRHRSEAGVEAGLNELIANVLSKPVPDAPKPITELPTPTPTSTPAGTNPAGNGSPTGSPAGSAAGSSSNSNTARPSTGTTTTTATKPATSGATTPAKPTASPTPKPKLRRANHRRP